MIRLTPTPSSCFINDNTMTLGLSAIPIPEKFDEFCFRADLRGGVSKNCAAVQRDATNAPSRRSAPRPASERARDPKGKRGWNSLTQCDGAVIDAA
jgi:hypothetical protein